MSGLTKLIVVKNFNSYSEFLNSCVICRNCLVKQQDKQSGTYVRRNSTFRTSTINPFRRRNELRKRLLETAQKDQFRDLVNTIDQFHRTLTVNGMSSSSKRQLLSERGSSSSDKWHKSVDRFESQLAQELHSASAVRTPVPRSQPVLHDVVPLAKVQRASAALLQDVHRAQAQRRRQSSVDHQRLLDERDLLHLEDVDADMLPHAELENLLKDDNLKPEFRSSLQQYLQKHQTPSVDPHIHQQPTLFEPVASGKTHLVVKRDISESLRQMYIDVQRSVKVMHKVNSVRRLQETLAAEENMRQKQYNSEMKAFVEAAIAADMLRQAHSAVTVPYVNRQSRPSSGSNEVKVPVKMKDRVATDVDIYNMLMAAWARLGHMGPVRSLFSQMESVGVTPTILSFSACLQCLGRQPVAQPRLAKCMVEDMALHHVSIGDLFWQQEFRGDEWQCIETAIKWAIPDFTVKQVTAEVNYNCALVNVLNDSSQAWPNASVGVVSKDPLTEQLHKQLAADLCTDVEVRSIEPSLPPTDLVLAARDKWTSMMTSWRTSLQSSFDKSLHMEELRTRGHIGTSLVPYLKLFNSSSYVDLMLQEINSLVECDKFSPNTSYLHVALGYKVYERFLKKCRIDSDYVRQMKDIYEDYLTSFCAADLSANHRQAWLDSIGRVANGKFVEPSEDRWPKHVAKAIGKFLYSIIIADIKIESTSKCSIPAFYNVYRSRNMLSEEEIKPHPHLVRLYSMTQQRRLTFDPRELPSLVPPIPWTGSVWGGDLLKTVNIIKNPWSSDEQLSILKQLRPQQMYPVYDALNSVSAVPWIINSRMLDVAITVFNDGGNMKLALPPPASSCPEPRKLTMSMSAEEKVEVLVERAKYTKHKKEMHSLWCTELYRLSIANKFRNDVFWFPHNIDFRGRAYACPPHFSHIGGDLARSILLFAQGKPLGPQGLDWLKIHAVNLTGLRKRSTNAERLAFANEVLPQILDSADNPLTGQLWWQQSDEPWQTLAACMEIAKACRSPDPSAYVCHYPVHQDGSCNGLQHYAALGRDQIGAQSVNLQPSQAPCDVYSDVVEMIEQERQRDALAGLDIAQRLENFVQRKAVKQTIMTTVYGVTPFGARLQIRDNIGDISNFPAELSFPASFYLAEKTFSCLQKMFTSAKEIQDWLVLCADVISRLRGQPVQWVTPLGLPVIQPYYDSVRLAKPNTAKNTAKSFINIRKPNEVKQRNAFPPNFVHSLDSVHFMLTALHCARAGVTFVSVHDCFWTHPSDVNTMGRICREQFVLLHSQPILEDLSAFLVDKFAVVDSDTVTDTAGKEDGSVEQEVKCQEAVNSVLSYVPRRGNFDLSSILRSTYFFS